MEKCGECNCRFIVAKARDRKDWASWQNCWVIKSTGCGKEITMPMDKKQAIKMNKDGYKFIFGNQG